MNEKSHKLGWDIWQFFFNKTEYICAVGEAFETFSNMNLFNTYYTRCFNELAEMLNNGEFSTICDVWNDTTLPFEERSALAGVLINDATCKRKIEDLKFTALVC